jgi:sulfopyruvate decarboxylase TPP-binding subunit
MTLRHHVLSVPCDNIQSLLDFAKEENFIQFSFSFEENNWVLSAPLDVKARARYAWLYHKTKGLEAERASKAKE